MLCVNLSCPYIWCTLVAKYFTRFFCKPLATFLICSEVNDGVWRVRIYHEILIDSFPCFLCLSKATRNEKWSLKTKLDHPRFVDKETIPLVQDEDYDDYRTPDLTSFTEPDTTEATSTLQLRQKVKQDKINAFYRHLNVTGDPGLANIDRFMIKKIQ